MGTLIEITTKFKLVGKIEEVKAFFEKNLKQDCH